MDIEYMGYTPHIRYIRWFIQTYIEKRERERDNKKKHLFTFSWEESFPAILFCVHHLPGYLQQSFSTERWLGVRMKQVGSNWMLCKDLQTWSQQKPLHLLYIDFSNIWFIHQHPTNPSKIVPFRIHSIGPSFCDILESWFEAALGFEHFPAKNGGWPCGEVTNVHDRARGYRVLRVKCGFSVNMPCQSGDLFCCVYIYICIYIVFCSMFFPWKKKQGSFEFQEGRINLHMFAFLISWSALRDVFFSTVVCSCLQNSWYLLKEWYL